MPAGRRWNGNSSWTTLPCCPQRRSVSHDYDFTNLSFARFRCAIRDLALVLITFAATSASLIVCSILSGAIPRRIRPSITCFLRSDLIAFHICLASANMPFGIFVIPLHYRVSIYGANRFWRPRLRSIRNVPQDCRDRYA